jgi:hypothetical protein
MNSSLCRLETNRFFYVLSIIHHNLENTPANLKGKISLNGFDHTGVMHVSGGLIVLPPIYKTDNTHQQNHQDYEYQTLSYQPPLFTQHQRKPKIRKLPIVCLNAKADLGTKRRWQTCRLACPRKARVRQIRYPLIEGPRKEL